MKRILLLGSLLLAGAVRAQVSYTPTNNILAGDSLTNSASSVTPDFSLDANGRPRYALLSTNAAFTFLAPVGVDTTKTMVQQTVVYVTNTTAAAVLVTAPANCHAVGTMYVTNLTRFNFETYAQKWTNVFGVPVF